jgi:pimeloyl-ACP methyl ester carboxylesterase
MSNPKSGQRSEGMTMKYETVGDGQPVVLVPGGLTGWLSWKPHAERLARARRVVRVQLLAVELGLTGESLPAGYSVRYESEALARAVEHADVDRADFAAWSFGAEISLDYALNNPGRVRTLTLIEPPAVWVLRSRGPLSQDMVEQQQVLARLGPGPISEEQLVWFSHFAGFVPPGVDPRTLPPWPQWFEHRQSLRIQDAPLRHEDSIERVRKFARPVLLFKGGGSASFLHQIVDILGQEFPDAQVAELPGGHGLHIASMDRFLQLLNAFWERKTAG